MITLESIKEAVSKITPYPWIIERGQKSEETFVSAKKGGRILRIWNGRSAQEANALFIASAPEYIKWLIDRVEELEKCVELANQRAELTNEIMTGATANVNEIRTLKADLAKYKKLEDAVRLHILKQENEFQDCGCCELADVSTLESALKNLGAPR